MGHIRHLVNLTRGALKKGERAKYSRYIVCAVAAWSVFLSVIACFSYYSSRNEHIEMAKAEARASINKDIIYRHWSASVGGIYLPVNGKTRPNPYLSHLPERDLTTTDGLSLTLVNPAYMSRQVFDFAEKEIGVQSHITSLKPLRPENSPDPWEKEALKSFELGEKEASSIVVGKDNEDFMRLMQPLYVEQSCLKCHRSQGYKVGDIRGGISATIPMKRYWGLMNKELLFTVSGHFFLLFAGIGLILWGGNRLKIQASEIEESRDFIETVFDSIDDAIAVINADDFSVVKVNRAFLERYDTSDESVIGRKCYEIAHRSTDPCLFSDEKCPIAETLNLRVPTSITHSRCNSKGDLKHARVSVYPIVNKSGLISQVIHVTNDITEMKKLELELIKQKEVAEAASLAKSEFLAQMSHEIRNSLNAIRGYSYLINQVSESGDRDNYFEGLRRASDTLFAISSDILDLSKMEAGKLTFENTSFSVADIVSEVVEMFGLQAKRKNVRLGKHIETEVPEVLVGDPVRLKQVLINLVSNALKFSDSGEVKVSVRLLSGYKDDAGCGSDNGQPSSQRHVELLFAISDTGLGIPAEKQMEIFESYKQADVSISRKYGGTGLGLAICKKIVHHMDGRIWVNSLEGAGSVFNFTACFLSDDENRPVPRLCVTDAYDERGLLDPHSILLAEDEELNRNFIIALLQKNGYSVTAVQNGKEAVSLLSQKFFSIVLLDMSMPVMDGITAAKQIRDSGSTALNRDVPIILVTAYDKKRFEEKFVDIGINDYLEKPVRVDELIRVIRKWLPERAAESNKGSGPVNNNSEKFMSGELA